MWKASRITNDAAKKMQVNAGILVKNFNVTTPVEPSDENILFDTTGDFGFTSQPTVSNFFEGVNNARTDLKEGLQIDGWTNTLTITSLSMTTETLKASLGAADVGTDGGVRGRMEFKDEDFQTLVWLGDMADANKLFAIVLDNAVSTSGIGFTATNRGKGGISITFTAYGTLEDQERVPMAFYILTKTPTTSAGNSAGD